MSTSAAFNAISNLFDIDKQSAKYAGVIAGGALTGAALGPVGAIVGGTVGAGGCVVHYCYGHNGADQEQIASS